MSNTQTPITPSILSLLNQVDGIEKHTQAQLQRSDGYCNELIEVELPGGDALILKRARFDWVDARLRASRAAASLLRRRTGVLAPAHLDVEHDADGRAIEVYWRIPLPTLKELWGTIPDRRRPQALRSWGALLRRVHKALPGRYGQLHEHAEDHRIEQHLRADLRDRLQPAITTVWPRALPAVDLLLQRIDRIGERLAARPAVLVHSDFHMGNVLCEERPRSIRCVGVIDLESAWAGPPEADVAQLQVLHGRAFNHALPPDWFTHFAAGYGSPLDPELLGFFRILQLLNLGYFAAISGWSKHVADLEAELKREINGCLTGAGAAFSPDQPDRLL